MDKASLGARLLHTSPSDVRRASSLPDDVVAARPAVTLGHLGVEGATSRVLPPIFHTARRSRCRACRSRAAGHLGPPSV